MPEQSPTESLQTLIAEANTDGIREFLRLLPPTEAPHLLSRLSAEAQTRVLAALDPEEAAQLVQELPLVLSTTMLESLEPAPAAAIIDHLPSDEQTDVLTHLDPQQSEAVLAHMAPEEVADVKRLRDYPADTAGGLMVTEYLTYPVTAAVSEVLKDLRAHTGRYAQYRVQYAYVVSPTGELLGVAPLRDLLFRSDDESLQAAFKPHPSTVRADARLDDLVRFFDHHDYLAAPVVDEGGRIIGVVTRADVEEAAVDRAEQSLLRFSGIIGGEEFRTMPFKARVSGRLAWLGVTLMLSFVAASVVGLFEDTLSQVIALAVFLPVISGMSGNAGNQAIAVTLRELALGFVKPHEIGWVVMKEATVGAFNGLALGLVLSFAAVLWKGNIYLGVVVGCAQTLSVIVAACLGGAIPLVLKRLGFDPALASAPILTTITDASGFFLVLGFATVMLPLLT